MLIEKIESPHIFSEYSQDKKVPLEGIQGKQVIVDGKIFRFENSIIKFEKQNKGKQ